MLQPQVFLKKNFFKKNHRKGPTPESLFYQSCRLSHLRETVRLLISTIELSVNELPHSSMDFLISKTLFSLSSRRFLNSCKLLALFHEVSHFLVNSFFHDNTKFNEHFQISNVNLYELKIASAIHGFRNQFRFLKLHPCCQDMQKFRA